MDIKNKSAALYGRFSAGARERLGADIAKAGGRVARDLTRRSDVMVVGALASPLIEAGHLGARLAAARARAVPVFAERRFTQAMRGEDGEPAPSLPLAALAAQLALSQPEIDVLCAFDIVRIEADRCRFRDAEPLKAAADLIASGRSLAETVRILTMVRDAAPKGRRRIVSGPAGEAALQWETGLTTLDGQGLFPFGGGPPSLDDIFEAAAAAEADDDVGEAARLYEIAARADRKDPTGCFNLGNVKLAAGSFAEAALAFRQALSRDPAFVEARYNLAQVYERSGKLDLAREALQAALEVDPDYADARFNLAQIELKAGAAADAKEHFERYLAGDPPAEWAAKARRGIRYCAALLSA